MPETGSRTDPAFAFRFEVTLDNLAGGGFTEVSGLNYETEVKEYAEGGRNDIVHKFVTRSKQVPLILKKGIVDRSLWDWYYDLTQGELTYRDGTVSVRDEAGDKVVLEWQFRGAFPSKWTGPTLSASQSAVAVETLELTHQGLERRK